MNFFRRTLPSLDALVYFEAAARHLNYTHAARELRVTQVAVSKRVRALEEELGVALFARRGRGLVLTDDGQTFSERARSGLAFLEDAIVVTKNRSNDPRQLVQVVANENVNFFWLAPRVRDFQMMGNNAVVSVVTANNVADVIRSDTDLAIFYGKSPPDGWSAEILFDEVVAPVATRSYWENLESGRISNPTLLDYRREAPDWVNWRTLRHWVSQRWGTAVSTKQCSSYIQSIGLARAGAGIAVGALPLLDREFAEGSLQTRDNAEAVTGHKYYIATPEGHRPSPATNDLTAFLFGARRNTPL